MSAAVMSTSAVYDFGDTLLKNSSSAGRHHQHLGVRWTGAVGSPLDREALSRRASNPVAACAPCAPCAPPSPLVLDSPPPAAPATPVHRKLDRSHSEPANPAVAACKSAASAANINTSRYKTELCRPFEESGSCKYGDKCQFAHGGHELRTLVRHPKYKTELCRTYHTIGLCPYGPRCHFVHNDEESLAQGPQGQQCPQGQQGPQGVKQTAALPRPKALTLATAPAPAYLAGSTGDSPSPTSSLSQSPTNSHRSFFMSSEDVFGSVSPTPTSATANTAFSFGLVQCPPPCGSISSSSSRDSPSPPASPFRLPIFNHLSNQVMKIRL